MTRRRGDGEIKVIIYTKQFASGVESTQALPGEDRGVLDTEVLVYTSIHMLIRNIFERTRYVFSMESLLLSSFFFILGCIYFLSTHRDGEFFLLRCLFCFSLAKSYFYIKFILDILVHI